MTLKIAVTNQKGGVGKTTTAINVAGALAAEGADVLLVDLDPQGHSTEALGFADAYERDGPSLYDALTDIDSRHVVGDLLLEHREFDVIPSHVDMFKAESTLTTERRREERLGMALDTVDGEYDYLLIDCPPNLGALTDNGLLAAGNVLVPAQPRTSAIRALEILFDQIEALEETYDTEIGELGLIANEVRNDGESEEMREWFEGVFGEDRVYEVPTRVALQRAWNEGVSAIEHDESVPDAEATYREIAADLRAIREGRVEVNA